jgi:ankyrin repeat protein
LLSVLQRHLGILSRKDACGKTPLHYAIESANMRHMQWLFQAGAFIALKAKDVQELAHLTTSDAVRIQFLQNVQALDAINFKLRFEKGNYSQNQVEEGGNGDSNDTEEHGISIHLSATLERDTKTQSGPLLQSPLLKAAMFGNLEAVKLLLTKGADPMARDANGWTALHVGDMN